MEQQIDFTEWTDAQLDAAQRFTTSPNYPALAAEIDRRKTAGIWQTDGSHERVAAMVAGNPGLRGKRRPRRRSR